MGQIKTLDKKNLEHENLDNDILDNENLDNKILNYTSLHTGDLHNGDLNIEYIDLNLEKENFDKLSCFIGFENREQFTNQPNLLSRFSSENCRGTLLNADNKLLILRLEKRFFSFFRFIQCID